jgi:hypothetical protein
MERRLSRLNYCIYADEQGNRYFSVKDFVDHQRSLPDRPEVREAVINEMRRAAPGVLVLEEQTWTFTVDEESLPVSDSAMERTCRARRHRSRRNVAS